MSLLDNVKNTITKYEMLHRNEKVLVAVSGGADSICLLLCLLELKKTYDLKIRVFHFNHMLREEASDDADFVKKICQEKEIPFILRSGDVNEMVRKEGLSVEEAARKLRYDAMFEVADEDEKLAFAHNMMDQAETFLFRTMRGTGLKGAGGIHPINERSGYTIIRPLIDASREQIEDYLVERGQNWVEDKTNSEDEYARNRIRHHILDYARREINKNSVGNIVAFAEESREAYRYILEQTKVAFEACRLYDDRISIKKFNELSQYIQRQIILLMLENVTEYRKDLTKTHVDSILSLMSKSGSGYINLPYGLKAVKEYDEFYIDYDITPADNLEVSFQIMKRDHSREIPNDVYTKWLDYDKILNCVEIRTRRTGDYLVINDAGEKISLKKYMINEKIPSSIRDQIKVVADGSHVLWVVGYRISAAAKISDSTEHVLELKAVNLGSAY